MQCVFRYRYDDLFFHRKDYFIQQKQSENKVIKFEKFFSNMCNS